MEVRSWVIRVNDSQTRRPLEIDTYPAAHARQVSRDVIVKVFVSEPCTGIDATTFTLRDSNGALVPAAVDRIGDGTWALFPHRVFLSANETYTAGIDGRLSGADGSCGTVRRVWRFTTAGDDSPGTGDTRTREGFRIPQR
jgi:hypothetical protein